MNAAAAQLDAADTGKLINLSNQLESSGCYAKNAQPGFPMTNLFVGDSRLGCKSDADEQLILHISFREFVKVHSLKFTGFNQGVSPEENPTTIRLFVNRENLGFEDCDDVIPEQTLELTDEDWRESSDPVLLKYVKFQRVKSLTLFVEDNGGGDISALGGLQVMGRTVQTTNMNNFKKQG